MLTSRIGTFAYLEISIKAFMPICQVNISALLHRIAETIDMSFWQNVKTEIRNQNTTQEWVASRIGVRSDTFSRWIQRDTIPDADQAVAIAQALETTVEALVLGPKADPRERQIEEINRHLRALEDDQLSMFLGMIGGLTSTIRRHTKASSES